MLQVGIRACQEGENDHAEVVVVFEPEGTSLMMGGLHPRASNCLQTCPYKYSDHPAKSRER